MILTLFSVTACDDDKKDKPEYEVEVLFSEDVKIEWIKMKAERDFKKPKVQVHHPGGVEVTHVEREARKKVVYDFAPLPPLALLISILTMAILLLTKSSLNYASLSWLSPPTYQRG